MFPKADFIGFLSGKSLNSPPLVFSVLLIEISKLIKMKTTQESQTNKIIKGFFSLSFANVVFILAGYLVFFSLPRLLKTTEEFGNYGVVTGLLTIFNLVLMNGTTQSVSKFVSEDESNEYAIRTAAFKIQIRIGGSIFLLLFLGSPFFSAIFGDPTLIPYFRIAAFVPLCYAFYAVILGSLNGRKMFIHHAILDTSLATLKAISIITMAALGFGVFGALAGFSFTAVVILTAGLIVLKKVSRTESCRPFAPGNILKFEIWVMIITLLNNVLITLDLFAVKSLLNPSTASIQAAYYTAVQTFARIPFSLVMAVNLVVFPLISKATFSQDHVATRLYIQNAIKATTLIILPVALIFSCYPAECLNFVYPAEYAAGADALKFLSIAELPLALLALSLTIINSSGYPKISVLISICALALDFLLCYILVPIAATSGAAISSLVAWSTGLLMAAIWITKKFGSFLPAKLFLKFFFAGVVTAAAAISLPLHGSIRLMVGIPFIFLVYAVLLWSLKMIGLTEIKQGLAYLRHSRPKPDLHRGDR